MEIKDLKFDDKGLIPCIVQDAENNKVLMLAYMNKESIGITMEEQRTCFWSRSRGEIWRKGATSGMYSIYARLKQIVTAIPYWLR